MHIALIDASLGTPHAERNFFREIDATLTIYNVNQGDMPPPIGVGGTERGVYQGNMHGG